MQVSPEDFEKDPTRSLDWQKIPPEQKKKLVKLAKDHAQSLDYGQDVDSYPTAAALIEAVLETAGIKVPATGNVRKDQEAHVSAYNALASSSLASISTLDGNPAFPEISEKALVVKTIYKAAMQVAEQERGTGTPLLP